MDSSTVNAIGQLAIEAAQANRIDADTPALILRTEHAGQQVVSIEHLQPGRSRFRGAFATRQLPDFAAYVIAETENAARERGSVQGFIDTDNMCAKVFFNLGNLEHAGHADHHATLKLKPTAAYAALLAATARSLDQRTLHDFVEDWRDNQAEAAWVERQETLMESGGPDDSAYQRDMINAGRGHLIGGA